MTNRDVTARLRVEMGQYERDMARASQVTETFGKSAEQAADKVEKAQKRQSDAAGQLRIAEQRLEELRAKGTASTSQMMAAEQRVTAARQTSANATLEVANAEQALDKANQQTASSSGRLATAARENREEWQKAGVVLLAAGGAVAGIGLAALKTGIEYNTLQQTSRAALTSLLGSSKAAADQMDRLDEFARTSPFSKATFISAQQQMLAFGIEAKKVVPYLDAIQNAVAASGGSNDDIAGITATMSKVQSSAKITAEDLNELGNRGVNAAELIGSQMGMTGAEIREAITAGSLDAETALDALVAGMSEKFDGAADNVKNTFAGAMDRVKAAWRDMSSALAEPFVGKEGGGIFTGLLNETADFMRQIEDLPGPVKGGVAVIGLLGSAAALAGGSFLLLLPRIAETKLQLELLQQTSPGAAKALGKLGSAARLAGIAFAALSVAKGVGELLDGEVASAERFGKAMAGLTDDSKTAREELERLSTFKVNGSFLDKLQFGGEARWQKDITGLSDAISTFNMGKADRLGDWLNGIARTSRGEAGGTIVDNVDKALTKMVTEGNADKAAEGFRYFRQQAEKVGYSVGAARDMLPGYTEALKQADSAARDSGYATADLADTVARLTEQWYDSANAALGISNAQTAAADALAKANELAAEGARIVYDQSGAFDLMDEVTREAVSALNDLAASNLAANEQIRKMYGEDSPQLQAALTAQRESFIAVAEQLGLTREQAVAYADSLGQIPTAPSTVVTLNKAPTWDSVYDEITGKLDQITGTRTMTTLLNFVTGKKPTLTDMLIPQANGGLVEFFAAGGIRGSAPILQPRPRSGLAQHFATGGFSRENHVAQIAPAGSWRVWAEDETPGPAFIPPMKETTR